MKRFAWLVGVGAMTAWGLSAAIVACGGDDSAIGDSSDASGSSSTSSGASSTSSSGGGSSSGGSSSGSTSSGGPGDGGTDGGDGGSSSGAITSNPGKITCGTAECTAGTQVCCTTFSNNMLDAGCTATGGCNNGAPRACDEKADCPNAGDVCCGGALRGQCDNRCRFSVQLCKTSAECVSDAGGGCKTYTCQGGVKVDACEKPQGCN